MHDPSRYNTYSMYNPSYCLVRLPSVDFRVDPARFMQQPGKIRVLAFTGTVVNRALPCHLGMECHLKLVNKRKTFCYIFIVLFLKFVSLNLYLRRKLEENRLFTFDRRQMKNCIPMQWRIFTFLAAHRPGTWGTSKQ